MITPEEYRDKLVNEKHAAGCLAEDNRRRTQKAYAELVPYLDACNVEHEIVNTKAVGPVLVMDRLNLTVFWDGGKYCYTHSNAKKSWFGGFTEVIISSDFFAQRFSLEELLDELSTYIKKVL